MKFWPIVIMLLIATTGFAEMCEQNIIAPESKQDTLSIYAKLKTQKNIRFEALDPLQDTTKMYIADIDNDGRKEHVFKSSQIVNGRRIDSVHVFRQSTDTTFQDGGEIPKIPEMNLPLQVYSNPQNNEDQFLVEVCGSVYMQFQGSPDQSMKAYMWQNGQAIAAPITGSIPIANNCGLTAIKKIPPESLQDALVVFSQLEEKIKTDKKIKEPNNNNSFLYIADINNDGEKEYIFTSREKIYSACSHYGRAGDGNISIFIFKKKNDTLIYLGQPPGPKASSNRSPWYQDWWWSTVWTPDPLQVEFLVEACGSTFMQFSRLSTPGYQLSLQRYVWKNEKVEEVFIEQHIQKEKNPFIQCTPTLILPEKKEYTLAMYEKIRSGPIHDYETKLYIADINNDGEKEYIFKERGSGTFGGDDIYVYKKVGNKFVDLDGIPKDKNDQSDGPWYVGVYWNRKTDEEQFLVEACGSIYMQMRLNSSQNLYAYLWKNGENTPIAVKRSIPDLNDCDFADAQEIPPESLEKALVIFSEVDKTIKNDQKLKKRLEKKIKKPNNDTSFFGVNGSFLHIADINNDGEKEYIFTSQSGDDRGPVNIFIFKKLGDKFIYLDPPPLYNSSNKLTNSPSKTSGFLLDACGSVLIELVEYGLENPNRNLTLWKNGQNKDIFLKETIVVEKPAPTLNTQKQ